MSGWTIAVIAIIFGVGVLGILWWIVFNASRKAALDWKKNFPDEKVVLYANGANCFGFPGEKFTLRGNGLLVLTVTDLHFDMWGMKKEMMINLGAIEHAGTVKSFAGRRGRLPLLHIVFRMPDSALLETAFAVGNAQHWADTIRTGIRRPEFTEGRTKGVSQDKKGREDGSGT
jgi:hypothetical protein